MNAMKKLLVFGATLLLLTSSIAYAHDVQCDRCGVYVPEEQARYIEVRAVARDGSITTIDAVVCGECYDYLREDFR